MISLSNHVAVDLDKCCALHWQGLEARLRRKRLPGLVTGGIKKSIRDFLSDELENIISAKPPELLELNNRVSRLVLTAGVSQKYQRNIQKSIANVFSYRWLSNKPRGGAYWIFTLANNLAVDVCPYCNANFTITVKDSVGRKIARPAFDHFFGKASFPMLAISFYNLIPSCNICNSDIKGSSLLALDTHFHPFIHSIESDLSFTTIIRSYGGAYGFDDDFDLNVTALANSSQRERVENHLDAFRIVDIYQYRKGFAAEVMKRNYSLSGSYMESLTAAFPELNLSKADLYRFAYGNFLDTKDLGLRPMAKMTRDLVKEWDKFF